MIRILVVEDQPEKAKNITEFLYSYYGNDVEISIENSLRSGIIKIVTSSDIQLIVLDMSMPKFTADTGEWGEAEPVSFAGEEIMQQMMIRDISIPTLVLTQYSIFEKGSITLEDLDHKFRKNFGGFYKGAVYYSSSSSEWKTKMQTLLGALSS